MRYYHSSTTVISIIVLVISLTFAWTPSPSINEKFTEKKNGTASNVYHRMWGHASKIRNSSTSFRDRLRPINEWDDYNDHDNVDKQYDEQSSAKEQITTNIVVLTSLSGIYAWWPALFGGDDSFHLLLSQEDVPRFHDVTGDEHGNIYLTAPHERTVYRLQYSDGWWISNFSNHSLMNSIRSEMPLFVNIHRVSSILYVYGHSDIQLIDLLERPRTRGSAPFMKRLRELSPNLRISDLVIDQLTSEGYIIGDSYGWCIVVRCSLTVNECIFLFKIPSSYDNRPYPCTATIDFATKIMYLSLEDKILAVHLNEQTDFDRRFVLTEKSGPRSTLGYDDIIVHNNTILYTDVLRPILHICTLKNSNPCLNLSLSFPSPHRTILPLRLGIIKVSNLRPPPLDEDDDNTELHSNQSASQISSTPLTIANTTTNAQYLIADTTAKSSDLQFLYKSSIWMLLIGTIIGLLMGLLAFMIYYIAFNKNRPKLKQRTTFVLDDNNEPYSELPILPEPRSPLINDHRSNSRSSGKLSGSLRSTKDDHHSGSSPYSSTSGSSESTVVTSSSSSYQPHIVL